MTISKKLEGTKLELLLEGRLDTITAPTLEEELKQSLDGITELVLILESWNTYLQQDCVFFLQLRRL